LDAIARKAVSSPALNLFKTVAMLGRVAPRLLPVPRCAVHFGASTARSTTASLSPAVLSLLPRSRQWVARPWPAPHALAVRWCSSQRQEAAQSGWRRFFSADKLKVRWRWRDVSRWRDAALASRFEANWRRCMRSLRS
jgi:hypothetical protein